MALSHRLQERATISSHHTGFGNRRNKQSLPSPRAGSQLTPSVILVLDTGTTLPGDRTADTARTAPAPDISPSPDAPYPLIMLVEASRSPS